MKFGEQLRSARERLGWSLREVAERTKIRADYLEALEEGDFARLPERPFARSFLQRYARELGLDPAPLLADFDRLVPMSAAVAASRRGVQPARRGPTLPAGLIASALSALVVLGALAWGGYAYYRSTHGATHAAPEPTKVPLASSRQVRLSVTSSPVGAKVYLDNVYLGTTPVQNFPVDARDGAELRLERGGFTTLRQHVALGSDRHLSLQLGKAAPLAATSSAGGSTAGASAAGVRSAGTSLASSPTTGVSSAAVSAAGTSTGGASAAAKPVVLRFVGTSWVRVTSRSGQKLYEGIPQAGSQLAYPVGVSVRVGSAGAVQVSVSGAPAQAFGPAGQPLTRSF